MGIFSKGQQLICRAPDKAGWWMSKEREGHSLGEVQFVYIDRIEGGKIYRKGEDDPMWWHGLWSGPLDMPKGWGASHLHEIH